MGLVLTQLGARVKKAAKYWQSSLTYTVKDMNLVHARSVYWQVCHLTYLEGGCEDKV